jgi:uncharacterized protein (TIGR01777 family)
MKKGIMTKVLITGGTGMIGRPLTRLLLDAGYDVVHLSRTPHANGSVATFHWNPSTGSIDSQAFKGVEHIVHLAGESIADGPWTAERRTQLIDSRVNSAELLHRASIQAGLSLKSFISASAIGYYPLIISKEMHTEESPRGEGLMADICVQWEAAADRFKDVSERVVKLRIGLVLAKDQGALKQISTPVKYYAAAGLGSGHQAMSWIHIHDVCRMFKHSIEQPLDGVFNAVGPDPVINQDFMQILADVMEKPLMLPNVPEFIIRWFFGDKSDLVLKGVPLSPDKILKTGFEFDYPTLNSALMQIYSDI